VWWIADDHPDLPAIVESPSDVTLTFGELAGRAHQIVHAIRAQGLGAGDIVAYALPNGVDMIWWQLVFQESGIHGISLNPSLSAREVRAIVDHAGADGIVIDAQLADLVPRAL
jgi:long-chain acyl-CoA synthetase